MSMPLTERQVELRSLILDFLSERLNAKLEKLAADDPKRNELRAQFTPSIWLGDAAHRVSQIKAVTHSLKPIHPDARGTNLFCTPETLPPLPEVGTHALGRLFEGDVVGNAAALDVYKFLKLQYNGRTLLALSLEKDADLAIALNDDANVGHDWMTAFARIIEPQSTFSSHTLAKQLYWPLGNDPHEDTDYHLLAPLYPTSLVHRVYQILQDDRFSEEVKAARQARKAGKWHEHAVHEYPHLAVQKLGGTKPQNISQLNSERRGDNYLLASLPPVWRSPTIKPLFSVESLFDVFRWRREVRAQTKSLRRFLEDGPVVNQETRRYRDSLIDSLLDELIQFTAEVRLLDPGWTNDPQCVLYSSHRVWLDPQTEADTDDIIEAIAGDFARWLNTQLRDPLPVGDPEYMYWRKLAREQIKDFSRGTA
jgi:CRISPR-associated protein Csy1